MKTGRRQQLPFERLMHNHLFCFACIGCIASTSLGYLSDSSVALWVVVSLVCLIGVPHGGLDHLAGRKHLSTRWGKYWGIPFLAVYLSISIGTIVGWLLSPLLTSVAFFLVSASHFGLEDRLAKQPSSLRGEFFGIASGGLVIWVPAVARPTEMQHILDAIVPVGMATSSDIVLVTQILAAVFIPIAVVEIVYEAGSPAARKIGGGIRAVRQILLISLFVLTPILISFCIYFCGWHSIRGLQQLMQENHMKLGKLALATMPMSLAAIAMVGFGMWFWNSGRELSEELTRSLFVGLSAMAVPHLALHAVPSELRYGKQGFTSTVGGVV